MSSKGQNKAGRKAQAQNQRVVREPPKPPEQAPPPPQVRRSYLASRMQFSNVQVHPKWPELPVGQGELFFECTLFLYSVLALFLQYLNLYKTLWWLPKSYWPNSLKFYMINPYLLSCIGLMLGVRVTRCFWNNITDMFALLTKSSESVVFKIIEYGVVKTPICTMVMSSFAFSFTRVYVEHGGKAIFYFALPLMVYIFLLWTGFDQVKEEDKFQRFEGRSVFAKIGNFWLRILSYFFAVKRANSLMDLETVAHLCTTNPTQIRAEAGALAKDFLNRLKYSIFAGFSTAYLSVYLPCAFLPEKSTTGLPQFLLMNNSWVMQIFLIVALTSFSVYFTYLLPLTYFDLLQRSAVHLGRWESMDGKPDSDEQIVTYSEDFPYPYMDKQVIFYNNQYYQAVSAKGSIWRTVAASPGDATQFFFFRISNDPVRFITFLCIFEFSLILFQFWLLILTTDWQHIVTLVLLMFANYLLLGKLFKDRVVIGRIYKPSTEDIAMWKQLSSNPQLHEKKK